jgi:hypothetical protein
MDRLISEQKAIEAINDYWGEMETPNIDGYINAVKAIPPAYKGMTNGEVIKAVFPNFHTDEMSHTVWVGYDAMSFHRDWWDSPYEPQESEG